MRFDRSDDLGSWIELYRVFEMDEIAQVLNATLQPHVETRQAAERALEQILDRPNAPLMFAQVLGSAGYPLHLRQSAGVTLRRLIKSHWSPAADSFKAAIPTQHDVKVETRAVMVKVLEAPERQLRMIGAAIISEMAHWDWPDDWPDLLDHLVLLLNSAQPAPVHGALAVLAELVKTDLTEDQLIPLSRNILPLLTHIVADPQMYNSASRARAIAVFRESLEALFMVKEQFPAAVSEASKAILPQWTSIIQNLLAGDLQADLKDDSNWQNLAVRIECFKTLVSLLDTFPKALHYALEPLLQTSGVHLTLLSTPYTKLYLYDSDEEEPLLQDEGSDLSCSLTVLLGHVFDFLRAAAHKNWAKFYFVDQVSGQPTALLAECINKTLLTYAGVSVDNEEAWQDANIFTSQEEQEGLGDSVRECALDFLHAIEDRFGRALIGALNHTTHLAISSLHSQANGSWKQLEGVLLCLGSISQSLVEWTVEDVQQAKQPSLDVETIFGQAAIPSLSAKDRPFLQGRAFVFCSRFVKILDTPTIENIMQHALANLNDDGVSVSVKLSGVRALANCFRNGFEHEVLPQYSWRTVAALLPILSQATESVLEMLLESIEFALRPASPEIGDAEFAALTQAILRVWFQHSNEPLISMNVANVFGTIATSKSTAASRTIFHLVLPELCKLLTVTDAQQEHIAASALEIIDNILQSVESLDANAYARLAPSLFSLLRDTDSPSILQLGLEVLNSFVKKDCGQILGTSEYGLHAVFSVIAKVLGPDCAESGGLFIGDLIIQLFRKAGDAVTPTLPDLLRALLVRLSTASTAGFSQSLIMPFALLFYTDFGTTMSLLEQVPIELQGVPPSTLLFTKWTENMETFQGFWAQRLSALALSKILLSRAPVLEQLEVRGDLLVAPSQGIVTRSKAKSNPDQYEAIPFGAKILKLLASELQADSAAGRIDDAADLESDDGDEEWEEDPVKALHELGFQDDQFLMEDDLAEDDELADDEISKLDLAATIGDCLKQVYQNDANQLQRLSTYLKDDERAVLQRAVT